MANLPNNLSQSFTQLSIMDHMPSSPTPPSTPTPTNTMGTSPHTQHQSPRKTSLLSILTIEDMFTEEPPTIHSNHIRVQQIFQQPSIVPTRTIISWTSFANIIITLEEVNCPSCAQAVILQLTDCLPFYEDNNERLEESAQRVGGVTILRKWYTLLFWSSVTKENTFYIPGTMGIPNPPSIFDNCRFLNLHQENNEEGGSDIIGEVETEGGEVIYIREEDIISNE